jgi:hypothetical protein
VDHSGATLVRAREKFPGAPAAKADVQQRRLRVVEGDWAESDACHHYYPPMERVRSRIADADFAIVDEAEGLRHDEGYAYHHVPRN